MVNKTIPFSFFSSESHGITTINVAIQSDGPTGLYQMREFACPNLLSCLTRLTSIIIISKWQCGKNDLNGNKNELGRVGVRLGHRIPSWMAIIRSALGGNISHHCRTLIGNLENQFTLTSHIYLLSLINKLQ
jgi:hypothetical protein